MVKRIIKRIATNNKVKVIDRDSPHFGHTGVVRGWVSKPVRMRSRYHLKVELDGTNTEEVFLPEHLEKIG